MSLHKHGLKIKIDDLKSIAKRFRKYNIWNDSHYSIYYNKQNGEIWVNEYVDGNSWTEYTNNDIIYICSFQFGGLSQQKIIDYIATKIYGLHSQHEFIKKLYYTPKIIL